MDGGWGAGIQWKTGHISKTLNDTAKVTINH